MRATGAMGARKQRRQQPSVATLTREDGVVVCERCVLAESIPSRVKGLLGRTELPAGEGLLLRPASSIHTFFMRFPIDVVFLDRHLVVRKIAPGLRPWRGAFGLGSHAALELAAGECERRGLVRGDQLVSSEPGWVR
jgi:uncharacterized membrane protein (UPF0127 family)